MPDSTWVRFRLQSQDGTDDDVQPGDAEDLVQRNCTARSAAALGRWRDVCCDVVRLAYVAFVTDVFSRRTVGWNITSTLTADLLPLRAPDRAA